MKQFHLRENEDGYEVVWSEVEKHLSEVYGIYMPGSLIIKIGYKYDVDYEEERVITNEFVSIDPFDKVYWDNDWWEGQKDIIVYGFSDLEETETRHEIGDKGECKDWIVRLGAKPDEYDFPIRPIVYCKDCKHRIINDNYGKRGYLKTTKATCEFDSADPFELTREADNDYWFCADGEFKEKQTKGEEDAE